MSENIILDLDLGNLEPIQHKLKNISIDATITNNVEKVKIANFIIISGVGHFDAAMNKINSSPLLKILNEKYEKNSAKILGICLGMQLFTDMSEEGTVNGLGWISGKTKLINNDKIKVPNINWLSIELHKKNEFLNNNKFDNKFYFCHSYYCDIKNEEDILSTSKIKDFKFVSAILKKKIFGTQFHLEKSHNQGLSLIKKFYES